MRFYWLNILKTAIIESSLSMCSLIRTECCINWHTFYGREGITRRSQLKERKVVRGHHNDYSHIYPAQHRVKLDHFDLNVQLSTQYRVCKRFHTSLVSGGDDVRGPSNFTTYDIF